MKSNEEIRAELVRRRNSFLDRKNWLNSLEEEDTAAMELLLIAKISLLKSLIRFIDS